LYRLIHNTPTIPTENIAMNHPIQPQEPRSVVLPTPTRHETQAVAEPFMFGNRYFDELQCRNP
jgi:hypothetical protein